MQVFLTILLISVLALLATSKRLYTLRRRRPVIMLISGGWLAILVGFALGPSGVALIDGAVLHRTAPLLMVGLGWIGLMIGLQLRRDVLAVLPRAIKRLALWDAAVSVLVFGAIGWMGMWWWTGRVEAAWVLGPAALIGSCGIGWSMETRSLRVGEDAARQRLALLVRVSAALCGVLAVGVFGVASSLVARDDMGGFHLEWVGAGARLGMSAALAVAMGLVGFFGLRIAGRSREEQLVVFLGVVAIVAGLATQIGVASIFATMLVGAVIANLEGSHVRAFERFILSAEHIVAVLFALLAGVLLSADIGVMEIAIALSIAGFRMMLKPAIFRHWARRVERDENATDFSGLPETSPLYMGPVRQSPVAIALAVGFYLLEWSELNARLLTIVVIAGFVSDLIPLGMSVAGHGLRRGSRRSKTDEGGEQ